MSEERGTLLGVVTEHYDHEAVFPHLHGANDQLEQLAQQLSEFGYRPEIVKDQPLATVRARVKSWAEGHRTDHGHSAALVIWSGHAEVVGSDLRFAARDSLRTKDPDDAYDASSLTYRALESGADQVLILIDTCFAGAVAPQALKQALERRAEQALGPGRSAWLGILASCQADEQGDGAGVLLETARQLLSTGPDTSEYRHEWSVRNRGITGATLAQAICAQWPTDSQRPVLVTEGRPTVMFRNPRWQSTRRESLVEHLVLASRGIAPTEEGWFFTGRTRVLEQITGWLAAGQPGLFLVTGGAGCGKSAVAGRIAALSDPAQRAAAHAHGAFDRTDPDPGERSIAASVHLRGLDAQQLAVVLADRLGLPEPQTPAALIDQLQQLRNGGQPPVAIVLDGLDEAAPEQAHAIAEQVLVPLSQLACVLLATRDRPFRLQQQPQEPLDAALARTLGTRVQLIDLEAEPDTRTDLTRYLTARLRAAELNDELVAEVAPVLAARAVNSGGGFLFARIVAADVAQRLREQPETPWQDTVPDSIAAAFAHDLDTGPQLQRGGQVQPGAVRALLSALAWSEGNGVPAGGVWETMAAALRPGGPGYDAADLDQLLTLYGRFIVEDSDGEQAVYRLYHREFVDFLRQDSPLVPTGDGGTVPPALALTGALIELTRQQTGDFQQPDNADPYLRRTLWLHAATAGDPGVTRFRALAEANPTAYLLDLASALNNLAMRLAGAGQREAALAPAQEAADLSRSLVQAGCTAHLPELAAILGNLTGRLSELGRRDDALASAQEVADLYRSLAEANPADHLPNLARALNNLAACVASVGQREAALTPAQEATDTFRTLAQANPSAHLPLYASSLNNLAIHLNNVGQRNAALGPAQEATDIYRVLAEANPAAHLPHLAGCLNSLAAALADVGRLEAALAPAQEAVTLQRALTRTNPAAHSPHLAGALNNLAMRLADNGQHQAALAPAQEAVSLRRSLAEANPTAYLPDLALSLNSLATRLADVGEREAALAHAQEAVTLRLTLAEASPDAHLPDLANSLHNLAMRLADTGQHQAALAPVQEAVTLHRTLARANPGVYLPHLANSLDNLATRLADNGQHQAALAPALETVPLHRALAEANPDVHLPNLAGALNNLAVHLTGVGRHEAALAPAQEAVALHRALTQANPSVHLPHLAGALNNLASQLADNGQHEAALVPAQEAVAFRRLLVEADLTAHLPALALSLHNLAVRLAGVGQHDAALEPALEAVILRRRLAQDDPAAHLPDLAGSLNNIAIHLAGIEQHAAALAPAQEASDIYRALARSHPAAHVPALGNSLSILALLLAEIGEGDAALAAYCAAIDDFADLPDAAAQLVCGLADFLVAHDGIEAAGQLLAPLSEHEAGSGLSESTVLRARQLLRDTGHSSPERSAQLAALWPSITGQPLPAWARLSPATLRLAAEWIDAPSSQASLAFLQEHEHALLSPETHTALEELSLMTSDALDHLALLDTIQAEGAVAAYDIRMRSEMFVAWMETPSWAESRDYLRTHPSLLEADAVAIMDQFADVESAEGSAVLHTALLDLVQQLGLDAAYACVTERHALHDLVQQALHAPDGWLLDRAAVVEWLIFEDAYSASLHCLVADILLDRPTDPPCSSLAEVATDCTYEIRDRCAAEIAALIGRAPEHAVDLSTLLQAVLATVPAA